MEKEGGQEDSMERTDRNEKDDAQKAKLIFISLAALVTILLIVTFVYASKARTERNTAQQELEAVKQDNAKLEQMLKDQSQEIDALKKQVQQLEAKAKAKPAAKKKTTSKSTTKKSSRSKSTKSK
jgi:regulatory protein YycI of two-component signal transduction system YycFG